MDRGREKGEMYLFVDVQRTGMSGCCKDCVLELLQKTPVHISHSSHDKILD